MAHLEKFSRGTIGHALGHDCRQQDDGVKRSNEKIDNSRTHLNYSLHPHSERPMDFINRRTSEVRCMKRDDVVVAGSWVVTLPKEYKGDERRFFEETYRFLADRYGEKNVISAWVHNDETTPHLHFKFVPVVEGKKGEKVCMKECCPRSDYKTFHTDLETYLCEHLGISKEQLGVLNGATDNGNKTIQELKSETLEQQNEVAQKSLRERQRELAGAEQELAGVEQELAEVNAQIEVANKGLKKVLDKKARASEIKRGLFDRDVQSYHVNMLESTRKIGAEAFDELTKANETMQQAVAIQVRAERKEQEIEPLHQQAERERKQAQYLRENAERLISEQAAVLAEKALQSVPPEQRDRLQRIERFMSGLEYADGTNALERFRESESRLTERVRATAKKKSGMER